MDSRFHTVCVPDSWAWILHSLSVDSGFQERPGFAKVGFWILDFGFQKQAFCAFGNLDNPLNPNLLISKE